MADKFKPIICVDFDGVLHSYKSGWLGGSHIADPPVEGALEWLAAAVLSDKATIAIYSSRSKDPENVSTMKTWLWENLVLLFQKQGMLVSQAKDKARAVTTNLQFPLQKPAASMTIDDRAHCFMGRFRSLEWYLNFKPWNKRPPEQRVPDYTDDGVKGWNDDDEELSDQALETLLDCLITGEDGYMHFEGSALEFLATMFQHARESPTMVKAGVKEALIPEKYHQDLSAALWKVVNANESRALDSSADRHVLVHELLHELLTLNRWSGGDSNSRD